MLLSLTNAMESESLNFNLVFDYVSVFAPVLLIIVTCLTIFHRIKSRWPVKVNCWFCNENTKIHRQDLDWWLCSWCEQYNGFCKNGDYAYDIPEQYTTLHTSTKYCQSPRGNKEAYNIPKSNLCMGCNKRENLKLLELSNFEPKDENLYSTELKMFTEYLEKRYPLCNNCKSVVRDVLRKQALWLTYYKMLFFRQKPVQALISRRSKTISRVISIILDSTIMYNHDCVWLPIGGLFFHLHVCWTSLMKRKTFDVLLTFLRFCMMSLISAKNLTILQNDWLTAEHIAQYHMITICVFIIGFLNVKPSLHENKFSGSVAFKKLKSLSRDTIASQFLYNNESKNNSFSDEMDSSFESAVCAASKLSSTEIKSHSAISKQKLSMTTGSNSNPNSVSQSSPPDNCCLNDSLSTLFLSEDSPTCNRNARVAPTIFERKIYSAVSSENLFKKSINAFNRRNILSPPKLRSVTQTSWVAGGYWQDGMMTTPPSPPPISLSRSSSQSSGFGSASSSNLAPSREPSVLNELDRCSVVSDATRWSSHTPLPRVQSRRNDAAKNCSQSPSPIPATRDLDNHVHKCHVRGSSVGNSDDPTPTVYVGHTTTTVVTSPVWLSALLCGSLILNIIVLCIMLLR
ncbi:uncharacterized protein [Linepithema humile]|uniref:uncharacterized protein n=1 Tax=Linepithema humile TaxID=83485 RepID=UPI00062349EE|nr:PREDICTED: uncharacterized protein LOC105672383 [Linepithema humile]XP_012222705.1 PREDICTED: uncharacterized protein LOC105672383 [Linepithema humile]